ncbi:hypothetical protein KM043_016534 [Ampulex compressa]|nr:hypothetical protein KM043_016534 [Ampulex compressa]
MEFQNPRHGAAAEGRSYEDPKGNRDTRRSKGVGEDEERRNIAAAILLEILRRGLPNELFKLDEKESRVTETKRMMKMKRPVIPCTGRGSASGFRPIFMQIATPGADLLRTWKQPFLVPPTGLFSAFSPHLFAPFE